MRLNVSAEIAEISDKAAMMSVQQGQYYVGVEHLFAALLDNLDRLPQVVREKHLDALFTIHRECLNHAWRGGINAAGGEVFHTPRAIAVTNNAGRIAQKLGHHVAGGGHLLLAILSQENSAPSRAMAALKMDRVGFCELIKQALLKAGGVERAQAAPVQQGPAPKAAYVAECRKLPPAAEMSTFLPFDDSGLGPKKEDKQQADLTRDLTAAAREGKLQPVIGRDQELVQVLQILTRKNKNNAMLVGEAGVGKTQLVEGLAIKLAQGAFGDAVPPFHVYELSISALMTGTAYRGAFEEKVLGLIEGLKRDPNAVLFIDEVHLIMGAGATDGDAMDMANLLKPVLARGEIRVIGATTLAEYRKFVEKDPAIERRFQMVRLEELSPEATLKVLERLRPGLEKHHGVTISGNAIEAAVELTERYLPNLNFPDKAIDVLDQACARHRMNLKAGINSGTFSGDSQDRTKVTRHGIIKVMSQITSIPLEQLNAEQRRSIRDLDKRLKKRVIGQDEAVNRVAAAVKKSRAGLADPNRPDSVMLFLGPSGVGKTQLAKTLSRELFGSKDHLIIFDMSEYIEEHSVSRLLGAPPGYAGSDEEGRLSGAVRNDPFCILLFDEIEKAHPRIFDIFLPIFDEGRLKDNRGRMVSFRNCLIILTSNIGADLISHSGAGVDSEGLVEELRKHFRPELINRIDEIVPFYPLLQEDVREILRIEVNNLRYRLRDRHIKIHMYQQAYEYLGDKGYQRNSGAREIRRVVDKYLTGPISELLLNESIADGDIVEVRMEDGELAVRKGTAPQPTGVN